MKNEYGIKVKCGTTENTQANSILERTHQVIAKIVHTLDFFKVPRHWEAIRRQIQKLIDKNNHVENKNCEPHTYRIRDKVLVRNKKANKYEDTYAVPYPITQVLTNLNVTIRRGALK